MILFAVSSVPEASNILPDIIYHQQVKLIFFPLVIDEALPLFPYLKAFLLNVVSQDQYIQKSVKRSLKPVRAAYEWSTSAVCYV